MNLKELVSMLREWMPDATGVRGGSGMFPPQQSADDFPYDKPMDFGQPTAQSGGQSHQPITPKDTNHTVWDEIMEALGTPVLFVRAYGGGQQATGVPGAAGGWAGNPSKPWDPEPELEEHSLFPMDPPPTESVPGTGQPDLHGQTDDDVENQLNRIWKQDNNPSADPDQFGGGSLLPSNIYLVAAPDLFSMGLGSSRTNPELVAKESAWGPLELVMKKM